MIKRAEATKRFSIELVSKIFSISVLTFIKRILGAANSPQDLNENGETTEKKSYIEKLYSFVIAAMTNTCSSFATPKTVTVTQRSTDITFNI